MRVVWTAPAARDLREIWNYIAPENPHAAQQLVSRLRQASHVLRTQPHAGRAGRVPHTREFVVPGTSYILVYRKRSQRIEILAAIHGARIH